MKGETDLSYLSAMYYTAAVLLVLTGAFATMAHSFGMAAIWSFLGFGLFAIRFFRSKKPE